MHYPHTVQNCMPNHHANNRPCQRGQPRGWPSQEAGQKGRLLHMRFGAARGRRGCSGELLPGVLGAWSWKVRASRGKPITCVLVALAAHLVPSAEAMLLEHCNPIARTAVWPGRLNAGHLFSLRRQQSRMVARPQRPRTSCLRQAQYSSQREDSAPAL